jgi:hypothetical protein
MVSTVYNLKLPPIATPDMNNLPLVPAVAKFLQQLPKFSLPSIAIPPFSELPIIKNIFQALSNLGCSSFIIDIGYFLIWVTYTVPLDFLQDLRDLPQWRQSLSRT